jgi:hypothetical protein
MMFALLLMTTAVAPAAAAQTGQRGGLATETQDRLTSDTSDTMWNLIGLLGLVGLIGLLPQHEDDSYHPSSFDE